MPAAAKAAKVNSNVILVHAIVVFHSAIFRILITLEFVNRPLA